MWWYNFAWWNQSVVNSNENIDSPDKIQARKEEAEIEREKLKSEFFWMPETLSVRQSIWKNEMIVEQDKNNIYERLITQLWKHKETPEYKNKGIKFNISNELKGILTGSTLPLKSWPTANTWEEYSDFSKRNNEFKNKLYTSIIEGVESKQVDKQVEKEQGLTPKDMESINKLNAVWDNQGKILWTEEQKEVPTKINTPELPENYDSVEAAPENSKEIVWWVCTDCSEILSGEKKEDYSSNKPTETTQNSKEKESLELFENSPYFPVLKDLRNNSQISGEKYNETMSELSKATTQDEKTIVTNTINSIDDKQIKNQMNDFINQGNNITKENFETSPLALDQKSIWIEFENIWWLESLLANNYFSIPNKDWELDKKQDFNRSIDISLNEIIQWNDKNFKKTNATLIWKIRWTSNLEYKYDLMKDLHKKELQNDSKYFKRNEKQRRQKSKENIIKELNTLQEEFKSWDITPERKKQIRIDFNELKKEFKKVKTWEANMWGWKLDKNNSHVEQNTKTA